jgi:hypothetical protein
MATVTPNFLWPVPQSTDLVKDGATAIEALGDSIDASLVDLKGGTTGQVLSKASGTDMDFTWTAIDPLVILDAKGDLITATAADTPARLAVGTNGQTLVADSTASTGLKWATPAAATSGLNYVTGATFSSVTSFSLPTDTFTSTYKNYRLLINFTSSSADAAVIMRMRASGTDVTSGGYFYDGAKATGGTTVTAVTGGSDTSWGLGLTAYIERAALAFDILNPKGGTSNDRILGNLFTSTMKGGFIGYWENGAAGGGYDSLSFIKASGTFGGYYRVYGYGDS